jgi:hypothetical protein
MARIGQVRSARSAHKAQSPHGYKECTTCTHMVLVRRPPLTSADIGRFALHAGVRYFQYGLSLYSRQNLWAEGATAHVLLGGPRLHVLQVLVRSEGPLWLRPILDVNSPLTSNMASDFTLIYAHDVRTGAKFAPRSLFAAKLVGRRGDGPRFAGGPKTKRPSAKVGVLLPHRETNEFGRY